MHFSRSDLQQLSPEYTRSLSSERVITLFEQLRQDLIASQDRLNQNPSNSSRPPSTRAPWERDPKDDEHTESSTTDEKDDEKSQNKESNGQTKAQVSVPGDIDKEPSKPEDDKRKRKPGRQPNSQGFGRTQKLAITHEEIHKPRCCIGCGQTFGSDAPFQATGGYCSIDIAPPDPGKIGISGSYTKRIFGTMQCTCGFETTSKPKRADQEPGWSVEMGEWRLIGPRLLAFLVFAKLRLHLTISKTRELLKTWLGISLSEGSIGTALLEAGRATSYLEPELLTALRASGLLHVDETSWKEHKMTRWLWVAVGDKVAYYTVGPRSGEVANQILQGFSGRLMTDGYTVYRSLANRLRCWAHLERKAKALKDSWDKNASTFGKYATETFEALRDSVYKMRDMKPDERKDETNTVDNCRLKFLLECVRNNDATHGKTRAFAREVLNDQEAIFTVLKNPELPLTNNTAERALRSLVILRKISYGSKTAEGSRTIALLASVTETLHMRGHDTWIFFAQLFKDRRSGQPPPMLPAFI
jgi:transposase